MQDFKKPTGASKRVLLSTIGSRGDVQPLVALALQVRALGHEVRLCAPPDFREMIESFGLPFAPVGIKVRDAAWKPSPEALRTLIADTVAGQFETIGAAAADCDVIVASTALQIAARSIAELRGIPYIFAAYSPVVLPSSHHAPPPMPGQTPAAPSADFRALWDQNGQRFNDTFGAALNEHRVAAGLAPVNDVRRHMFTDRPWLAADSKLGPWPPDSDLEVVQTGAWMMKDLRPLSTELETFLDAGEPPIIFGFGSTRDSQETSRTMVHAARALGYRAIISRGWANLGLVDDKPDCFSVAEANLQVLFTRVAAVVHHGGAGTTSIASRAGAPQVVVPHVYDQHYWARRIEELGIGVAHAPAEVTIDSLTAVLTRALRSEVAVRARAIASEVRTDGAAVAAHLLHSTLSQRERAARHPAG